MCKGPIHWQKIKCGDSHGFQRAFSQIIMAILAASEGVLHF